MDGAASTFVAPSRSTAATLWSALAGIGALVVAEHLVSPLEPIQASWTTRVPVVVLAGALAGSAVVIRLGAPRAVALLWLYAIGTVTLSWAYLGIRQRQCDLSGLLGCIRLRSEDWQTQFMVLAASAVLVAVVGPLLARRAPAPTGTQPVLEATGVLGMLPPWSAVPLGLAQSSAQTSMQAVVLLGLYAVGGAVSGFVIARRARHRLVASALFIGIIVGLWFLDLGPRYVTSIDPTGRGPFAALGISPLVAAAMAMLVVIQMQRRSMRIG